MVFNALRNITKGLGSASAPFNHAAFTTADLADARRGRPEYSLQEFCTSLGLTFHDSEVSSAFAATQPIWPDYVFNASRGVLPGGRYGCVAHELEEVSTKSGGGFNVLGPTFGGRSGGFRTKSGNEPFASDAAWFPITSVHVRAPEATRLGRWLVINERRGSVSGNIDLGGFGVPGYIFCPSRPGQEALAPVVGQLCAPWLPPRTDSFVRLKVEHGVVNLTVNGYRHDPADLRQMIDTCETVADGLAALFPTAAAAPFAVPGPSVGSAFLAGVSSPDATWSMAFATAANGYSMHNEDPTHLITLLPRNPIPGVPWGVLYGTIPGTSAIGRVAWYNQGIRRGNSCRGAMVVAARPGATTPLGGIVHAPTAAYVEVVDGLAYVWRQRRSIGDLEANDLLSTAVATLRDTGMADI